MNRIETTWIIDDDPIQIFVATKNLKTLGFSLNIKALKSGQDALEELSHFATSKDVDFPDVIFLDINMPQMDGWQFLEEFEALSLDKEIDIYLVTSSIDPEDSRRAETYKSVNGFLVKPLRREKLQEILDNYEQ